MPEITFGFDAHQPHRVNREFTPGTEPTSVSLMDQYFDPMDREIVMRAADRCYQPAIELILRLLDEGFACAFSASGILLEQLEQWSPDTLSLFKQLGNHRNMELIATPYYHGVTSLFFDHAEFREEIREHMGVLKDLFHKDPVFCANTDLLFNNEIASTLRTLGFQGAYMECAPRILGKAGPNHLFSCQYLPVLVRNAALCDDITLRFTDRGWDHYPLTADIFARWVAASTGEIVTLFLNFETFGELLGKETGILNFLEYLPEELQKRGVKMTLPSSILDRYQPVSSLDVSETITWSDLEKNTSAFLGNEYQRTAFDAIQNSTTYPGEEHPRRCLRSINHFYEMASGFGTSGERHAFLGHLNARDAFHIYMRVISDYEDRSIPDMGHQKAAMLVRALPPEKSFHFASPAGDIGHIAFNLDQFLDQLKVVPDDSLDYHLGRRDFSLWIREVLKSTTLAKKIQRCSDRQELVAAVEEAREKAWKLLR